MTRTFVFLLLLCTMFIDNIKSSEFENHGRQQFETFKVIIFFLIKIKAK